MCRTPKPDARGDLRTAAPASRAVGAKHERAWGYRLAPYHPPVLRLCLVFLIVLLPLRGLAGDLLCIQMASGGAAAGVAAAMPPDCPMHAVANAVDTETEADSNLPSVQSCDTCELCMPLAEVARWRADSAACANHAKPVLPSVAFSSASAAPRLEPPIN